MKSPRRAQPSIPNWVVAIVVVASIAAGWLLWRSRAPDVANVDSRGSSIIAFGDSLTAGYGAGRGEDFPSRLSELASVTIINAGVSGDTTGEALARIESDVLARDPRIVIVGLGGNDYLRHASIAKTEENLRTIVRRIQDAGAMVVLLGFRFPSLEANYEEMYERIAEEEKCLLVPDILDGILSDPKLKSDEIHPNALGYQLMAERIASPVAKLIAKADSAR